MTKLALRSLAAHKLRLVFTAMAVTLGVAFVAGTMIFRATATQGFDTLLKQMTSLADVTVEPKRQFTTENAPPRLIPHAVLTDLQQKVPDASGIRGAVDGYAAVLTSSGQVVGGESTGHVGITFAERPGSQLKITTGKAPTGPEEVAVEGRTAADGALSVGDTVEVQTLFETRKMKVSGLFDLEQKGFSGVFTFVAFAPDVAQKLLTGTDPGGPKEYSAIYVRSKPEVTQAQLAAQVRAVLPPEYDVKAGDDLAAETKKEIDELFDLLNRILLVFAVISILVGTFIIFNTFTMLLAQRTRELALLRAVGASRGQLTRVVLGEAAAIGVLGSTLGLLGGIGVSYGLRALVARFGAQLPASAPVISPRTIITAYAVGIVVTVLAAYFPARRATKIPPVAALRDDVSLPRKSLRVRLIIGLVMAAGTGLALAGSLSAEGEEAGALVAVGGVLAFITAFMLSPALSRPVIRVLGAPITWITGITGRLSQENARRDPRRTAATASALMIGLSLVSMATVVASSMNASADRRLDREFGAEFSMEPRSLAGFSTDAVAKVEAVSGVRSVTPVQVGTIRITGKEEPVVVADPAGLAVPARLKLEEGNATLGTDELLVGRTRATERGWQLGSTVAVQYPDGKDATVKVVGIFKDNAVVTQSYIMSPASYRAHASGNLIQRAFIDLEDENLTTATAAVKSALAGFPSVQLKDRQDAKKDAREDVDRVLNIIMALLALSIVIAAMGIVNTLGLSVLERTREIGLLRAVGMGRGQVRSMIRFEAVCIALFGATLGLGLGVGIGAALQRAMSENGIEVLDIPLDRLGIYLLSAVAIGVVAAIWPAWRATRMNILESIRQA
ncbi:FtsX-like permease family protein [Actinoplanes sp. NEAU-A12]|uniref:FtsX-like permease family protein n=1 Tax=Actinoplanes sandaracinus TaxID=3045177 RepID=A0ABT6WZH1_9ACTN|nr:FtsX-like permease family protein [Actinoplanes sandaracinus]MDI6105151.1 FtsX-like permease family protein [Actinoplanes sandaracinus]